MTNDNGTEWNYENKSCHPSRYVGWHQIEHVESSFVRWKKARYDLSGGVSFDQLELSQYCISRTLEFYWPSRSGSAVVWKYRKPEAKRTISIYWHMCPLLGIPMQSLETTVSYILFLQLLHCLHPPNSHVSFCFPKHLTSRLCRSCELRIRSPPCAL